MLRARIGPDRPGDPPHAFLAYSVEDISEVLPAALSEVEGTWRVYNMAAAPNTTYRLLSNENVEDLGCPIAPGQISARFLSDYQTCAVYSPSLSIDIETVDPVTESGVREVDYPAPPISAEAIVTIYRPATVSDRLRAARDWLGRLGSPGSR